MRQNTVPRLPLHRTLTSGLRLHPSLAPQGPQLSWHPVGATVTAPSQGLCAQSRPRLPCSACTSASAMAAVVTKRHWALQRKLVSKGHLHATHPRVHSLASGSLTYRVTEHRGVEALPGAQ